jgi:hypothetical protein
MMNLRAAARVLQLALLLALPSLCGCAGPRTRADGFPRKFEFRQDTFAFSNELFWVYRADPATGKMAHEKRQPKPDYALHCFAVARGARQFFQQARFDPDLPRVDEASYRALVRRVVRSKARVERPEAERIVIPGYANLREFSAAHEALLKSECGSMWASYFQRGNWRMVFHFSARHQERMAAQLAASLQRNRPPVVHLADFPKLHLNHAVLLTEAREDGEEIEFDVYDPNAPSRPMRLRFDREERRFYFPANFYFAGGRVDVYEVYSAWNY